MHLYDLGADGIGSYSVVALVCVIGFVLFAVYLLWREANTALFVPIIGICLTVFVVLSLGPRAFLICFVLLGGYSVWRRWNLSNNGVETTASIRDIQMHGHDGVTTVLFVTYLAEGRWYQGFCAVDAELPYAVGDTVQVLYNPKNPQDIELKRD